MSLSLTELQILAGLAQGKTLLEVGEQLFLTQPAISRALRQAEQKAGIQLCERHGRRIRLTLAGREIARLAQSVATQVTEVDSLIQGLRLGTGGQLRLIATTSPGNYVLPVAVGEFLQAVPDAEVELSVLPPAEMWSTFIEEGYDLGVGPVGVGPQPVDRPDLLIEPLYEDRIAFFVAPGSSLLKRKAMRWDDLRQETLIGPFGQPYWGQLWEQLTHRGFTAGRRIGLLGPEGVKLLVEAGGGVGVLWAAAVQREFNDGRLVPLTLVDISLALPYYAVRRQRRKPDPLVDHFYACLLRHVQRMHSLPHGPEPLRPEFRKR